MRRILLLATASVAAIALAGCNGLGALTGSPGGSQLSEAIKAIATDPNCGHTDRLAVALGPVPSGTVYLERNCPARTGAVQPGAIVGAPPAASSNP